MDHLVCTLTKKSTLISYQAQNQSTIVNIQHLVPMNRLSKKNSNTWVLLEFLKNAVPQSGPCLVLLLPKNGQVRHISDLHPLNKCVKHNQYPLPVIHDIM